jgi:hypothetical protein
MKEIATSTTYQPLKESKDQDPLSISRCRHYKYFVWLQNRSDYNTAMDWDIVESQQRAEGMVEVEMAL